MQSSCYAADKIKRCQKIKNDAKLNHANFKRCSLKRPQCTPPFFSMTMNFERLVYCFEAFFFCLNVFMMSKMLMLHTRFGDLPFNSCCHICEIKVVLELFSWRGKRDYAFIRKCNIFNLFDIYFICDTFIRSFISFARPGYL